MAHNFVQAFEEAIAAFEAGAPLSGPPYVIAKLMGATADGDLVISPFELNDLLRRKDRDGYIAELKCHLTAEKSRKNVQDQE